MAKVYVIGTFDTKEAELTYAGECLQSAGAAALLVDVSTGSPSDAADVPAGDVARCHPGGESAVLGQSDRGTAVAAMGEALSNYLLSCDDIGAVLGLGGSGNTAIVTAAMRALPVGVPKIMVSTMASGDVSAYVGPNDIAMMYSVVDIAGAEHHFPAGHRQRGACVGRHGDQQGGTSRFCQTGSRFHDVRGHDAMHNSYSFRAGK